MIITDSDIARARTDPQYRQLLLAKSLERLLRTLYRLQQGLAVANTADTRNLRKGAMIAVKLAELLRSIDDRFGPAVEAHS